MVGPPSSDKKNFLLLCTLVNKRWKSLIMRTFTVIFLCFICRNLMFPAFVVNPVTILFSLNKCPSVSPTSLWCRDMPAYHEPHISCFDIFAVISRALSQSLLLPNKLIVVTHKREKKKSLTIWTPFGSGCLISFKRRGIMGIWQVWVPFLSFSLFLLSSFLSTFSNIESYSKSEDFAVLLRLLPCCTRG